MSMSQKLVEDNIGLVYYLINRYYPTFITDEDVIQSGMLGLCQAANTYDESRGVTFASYASKCILNEVINEFERRKRYQGVISLETKRFSGDMDSDTIGDFLIGDEDIDYIDYDAFYNQLSPQNKELVDLKRIGLTARDIAHMKGCSEQAITKRLRKLRRKWRKLYGD